MTKRESEILQIIKENPFVSHQDIAQKLGITRSSVSVFLLNMQKKGIIEGRGYIVRSEAYPLIIGTSNVDIVGTPITYAGDIYDEIPEYSVFSDVNISFGGIAKNTAHAMVLLGRNPVAIFTVGSDMFGGAYMDECRQLGINVDSVLVLEDAPTAIFMEMKDANRSHVASTNRNPRIDTRLTPDFFKAKHGTLKNAEQICIQDSIPLESFEYLTSAYRNTPMFFYSSSYLKTQSRMQYIGYFDTLLISLPTALHVSGINIDLRSPASIDTARLVLSRLLSMGAKRVVMPVGLNNMCIASNRQMFVYSTGKEATTVMDSKFRLFRDTLMAGIMHCANLELSEEQTLKFLDACRGISLQGTSFVNPGLSLASIEKYIAMHPGDYVTFQL